jgi:hypothetical protein
MHGHVEKILIHRGRPIHAGEIDFIRNLIASNPDDHRTTLSRSICRAWNWTQPNGQPKDMVCRGLLLRLEAEGFIRLSPRQSAAVGRHYRTPEPILVDQSPIETDIAGLAPIDIRQVRRTPFEGIHEALLAQFHYLGYARPVGEHLKYLAFAKGRPVACLTWSSAASKRGCTVDRREAEGLYDSGREPTIFRLLEMDQQIQALKDSLAPSKQNSTNSSRSPSSDGPEVTRKKCAPTGRKPDAQKGHEGKHRELLPVEQMDHVYDRYPDQCEKCSLHLEPGSAKETSAPFQHQTFEVPENEPFKTEVRHHHASRYRQPVYLLACLR